MKIECDLDVVRLIEEDVQWDNFVVDVQDYIEDGDWELGLYVLKQFRERLRAKSVTTH